MSGLPFVVQPRLKPVVERYGNEDIGILEVERRGYLNAGEKTYLRTYDAQNDVPTLILGLVKKVSKAAKIPPEAAHKLVMQSLQGEDIPAAKQKVLDQHQDELDTIMQTVFQTEQQRDVIRASCMLHYRLGVSLDNSSAVFELHPDLIEALSKLCADEENKSTQRLQEALANDDTAELTAVEALEKKP